MDRDNRRIIIIDGNSLINRAYYAMQRPMITKEGLYTHGVYGFLNMLAKIQHDYPYGYIAVAFDTKAPTMRHIEYEQYKAGRKKMPLELAMQLPVLKEILQAMKIKTLELDGFEADDIIGTIAKEAENSGLEPLIITGDKDELQLATDKTSVIITRKGISEFDLFDRKTMEERYGFSPEAFIDFKGLMGDQSDNIPGIPGVGEKTATKLIMEFGSIENLIENVDTISNEKLRNKVKEHTQIARMSRRLATINTQVPLNVSLDEYKKEEPDYENLIKLYVKLEFNSFLKKLNMPAGNLGEKQTLLPPEQWSCISTQEELIAAKKQMQAAEFISIKMIAENNHRHTPRVNCFGILAGENYFYINGDEVNLVKETVSFITDNKLKICGHGLTFEYFIMLGILKEKEASRERLFHTYCDTEVAAYVIDPSRSNYKLKTLMLEYFNEEIENEDSLDRDMQVGLFDDNAKQYAQLCLVQCSAAAALANVLAQHIAEAGLTPLYTDIELPLIEVMAFMEYAGFAIDKEILIVEGEMLNKNIEQISQQIYELAGETFNINSPAQLGVILFEKLELPSGKKTKRGYSTSADILDKLKEQHPIINLILEYRTLSKLNGTYVEGLIPMIAQDDRIHAHFMQTVTATGRLSCTEPNLQNIPIKQEQGRRIRKAFIPGEGYAWLVGADYSQIELRVLAHMSEDENLIESFKHGDDIHQMTASKVFNVPIGEVTALQRNAAKAVNFGVIYGMGSFKLSGEINVSRKQAEQYIEEYFKGYAKVKQFMDNQVELCKKNGYVTSIMGRRRYISDINASNFIMRSAAERLAMNSPIQGSAADIIKIAMIKVYEAIKKEGLKSRLILQVHDELIIETVQGEETQIENLLKSCMENALDLKVRLTADLHKGENWYELK